jgi:peptide/nickel transport system permease protein
MTPFLVRRLSYAIATVFGISIIMFGILFLIPGDPADRIAGEKATKQVLENIRERYGLNKPIYIQYLRYVGGLVRGDLGESYIYHKPVSVEILEKLPASVQLAVAAGALQALLGIPLGILFALKAHTWIDSLGMAVSVVLNAFPPFWLGLMLIFVFGFLLGLLPMGGYGTALSIVLPAVTVAARSIPWFSRLTRSSLLDVMRQDFIHVARAKGLAPRTILFRHALRIAMLPIVTMWTMEFAFFFSGLVVIEAVFAWPGIGWQGWMAVRNRDIPLVVGTVLFSSLVVLAMNLLADIAHALIDPRIRYD